MYESVSAEPRGQVWVGGGSVRLPGGESGRGGSGEWPTGGRAKKPGRLGGEVRAWRPESGHGATPARTLFTN